MGRTRPLPTRERLDENYPLAQSPVSASGRRDLAVYIPQIFPGLIVLPQKHLPLNQAAIAVDLPNRHHFVVSQRVRGHALNVGKYVLWIDGKRDWRLPPLHGPFYADHSRMHAMPSGNLHHYRVLNGRSGFRSSIPVWPARRSYRRKRNRLNPAPDEEPEKLGLLEMGVHLHLVHRRLDPCIAQKQPQFWDRHIGGADVAHQAAV